MFDTVIRGARVVTPQGIQVKDIGIAGELIKEVLPPGKTLSAKREMDATGKYVLPGLVDAHMHLPNFRQELNAAEGVKNEFAFGTKAAAAGGVTTLMVMPVDDPVTVSGDDFDEKKAIGEACSHVDFALQALVSPRHDYFDELAQRGVVSFELFMAPPLGPDYVLDNDHDLLAVLQRIRDVDGVAAITANSGTLIGRLKEKKQAEGANGIAAVALTRPPVSQAFGIARACTAAAVHQTRIHIRQISSRLALDLYGRLIGITPMTCEVMSHHLLLTDEDAIRMGSFGNVFPPLRPAIEASALREALRRKQLDMVISDHSPFSKAEKLRAGEDMWKAPPGLPGLQTLCITMLGLVGKNELTLEQMVSACCEMPARAFGIYPRKGAILAGADADLVIVDPSTQSAISDVSQYSHADHTPYAGRSVPFAVDKVFLRGQLVAEKGEVVGQSRGRFVKASSARQAFT